MGTIVYLSQGDCESRCQLVPFPLALRAAQVNSQQHRPKFLFLFPQKSSIYKTYQWAVNTWLNLWGGGAGQVCITHSAANNCKSPLEQTPGYSLGSGMEVVAGAQEGLLKNNLSIFEKKTAHHRVLYHICSCSLFELFLYPNFKCLNIFILKINICIFNNTDNLSEEQ